jgi:hypothetical protein
LPNKDVTNPETGKARRGPPIREVDALRAWSLKIAVDCHVELPLPFPLANGIP